MLLQQPSTLSSGKQKRWPNPQDSTGVQLATLGRNKCCWEAIGPARSAFNILQGTIGEYIGQICEPLSGDVVWSLYMIGRTRETAYPAITFISREPGPRKRVKAHINQSTTLDEYPGFITMDIDRPPGCGNSVVMTLGGLHETYSNSQETQSQQISATVRSNNFMGTSIYLPEVPNLVATGGGLVRSRDKLFMASVAHPFEKHWNDRFPEEGPGDYIFDIDGISDDEEDEERMIDITSDGSVTSNSTLCDASDCSLSIDNYSLPDNTQLQEGPAATKSPAIDVSADPASLLDIPLSARARSQRLGNIWGDTIDGERDSDGIVRLAGPLATDIQTSESLPLTVSLSGPAISSARGGTIGLDYSLFELPNSILQQRNSNAKQKPPVSTPREARSTEVIVHTTSGPVAGRTLATPSFLQPTQGMLPQQLWTVIMEGTLHKGLCGAWVVDASTGDVFGHIIAGAPEDGFAYMVPFYEIIDDLNLHFGDGWSLVDSGEMSFETTPGQVVPSQGRNLSSRNSQTLSKIFAIDFSQALKVPELGKLAEVIKKWVPMSTTLDGKDVEARRKLDADGDDLRTFFIDYRDTAASLEIEVLEKFCLGGASLEDVKKGEGYAGSHRSIWLDDRNGSPEAGACAREYENPLTATDAFRALGQPRFNHETLPDATRRLIYVSDLSPACIHALAVTASSLHTHALRSAIHKHLGFQPSIAVRTPSAGFLTFELEIHLPFFILRPSTPPDELHDKAKKKPDRGWTDASFLKLDIQPSKPKEVWSLQEAQISCVITGTDNWRWIGYGFVDAEVDGLPADSSEIDLKFDQIGAGEMDASFPIWGPRDYWIRVFEIRSKQVCKEYRYFLHKLECAVNKYMTDHPPNLLRRPGTAQGRNTEMKEAFDWALQMTDFLRKPHDVLLATVKAWRAFSSENGDIGYFEDPDPDPDPKFIESRHHSIMLLSVIFRQLEEYQEKIVALNKRCSDYQKTLKLRLTIDNKEAADKNEFVSGFTVIFLYLVALAAAIFSMHQTAIPFEQSPRAFLLTIFILMIMVYVTKLFGKHAVPSLRIGIGWWVDRGEVVADEENIKPLR